jgi:hypothetical protein
MHFKKLAWLAVSALAATVLTACNIGATPAPTVDVNAIYTSAAETLVADFSVKMTQTAQAIPPTAIATNTPLATFTLLPTFPPAVGTAPLGPGTPVGGSTPLGTPGIISTPLGTSSGPVCNNSTFVSDVTIPDGTVMKPGNDFVKIWAIQNSGTCTWDDGYALVWVQGDKMDGYNVPLKHTNDFVAPGDTHNFEIEMTAHLAEGTYSGCWKMKDDQGFFFGTPLCYEIVVKK